MEKLQYANGASSAVSKGGAGVVDKEREIAEFLDGIVARVKEERRARGVSQLALAGILGHNSPNYVAKIETRKHGVSYNLGHLFLIAREFGIDVSELLPRTRRDAVAFGAGGTN